MQGDLRVTDDDSANVDAWSCNSHKFPDVAYEGSRRVFAAYVRTEEGAEALRRSLSEWATARRAN